MDFTREQLIRMDEIENAAYQFAQVLTDNYELEWDMEFIGEIADTASEIMTECGYPVKYPYRDDAGNIHDYV